MDIGKKRGVRFDESLLINCPNEESKLQCKKKLSYYLVDMNTAKI